MVVSRLHAALANLSPGGISKELNASDAVRLLGDFDPVTPVEQIRYDLALELIDDVKRLDLQLKESHKRIKTAVKASGTSLTELFGVGPILACGRSAMALTRKLCLVQYRVIPNVSASWNASLPISFSVASRSVASMPR